LFILLILRAKIIPFKDVLSELQFTMKFRNISQELMKGVTETCQICKKGEKIMTE